MSPLFGKKEQEQEQGTILAQPDGQLSQPGTPAELQLGLSGGVDVTAGTGVAPEITTPETPVPQQGDAAQPTGREVLPQQRVSDAGVAAAVTSQPLASEGKTPARKAIEEVLAEDLGDVFRSMPPNEQVAFRAEGVRAASTIEMLITSFTAKAKQLLGIVRTWLGMIPNVNTFFLEQESKLKTDELIRLQKKLKKEQRRRL